MRFWGLSRPCKARCPTRGPQRWNRMLTAGMRESSVSQYRRAISAFLVFLAFNAVEPEEPCEYVDSLVEYQAFGNAGKTVAPSHFMALLAGIERVLPHLKGILAVSHAMLES